MRSKLRRGVVTYFYKNPKARIYVRSLAKILEVDSTNLSRELARLAKEGFLRSEVEGKQLYYSINRDYRQLREVMDLLEEMTAWDTT